MPIIFWEHLSYYVLVLHNYTNAYTVIMYSINLQTSYWPGCIEYQFVNPQPHRTMDHFEDEDVLHSVEEKMCVLMSVHIHNELKIKM